jgi:hypothetical protein
MVAEPRIPWAWLALAVFIVAGAGVPEVASVLRWTLLLALLFLLVTHPREIGDLTSRLIGGLAK